MENQLSENQKLNNLRDIYTSMEEYLCVDRYIEPNEKVMINSDLHGGALTSIEDLESFILQVELVDPEILVINGDFFAIFENMFGIQNALDLFFSRNRPEITRDLDRMFVNRFFDKVINQEIWLNFFDKLGDMVDNPDFKLREVIINLGNHDLNYNKKGREIVIQQMYRLIPEKFRNKFLIGTDLVNISGENGQIADIEHGNGYNGIQALHEAKGFLNLTHIPANAAIAKVLMFLGDYLVRPTATALAFLRQHTDIADKELKALINFLNLATPLNHYQYIENSEDLIKNGVTVVRSHLHDAVSVKRDGKICYVNTGTAANGESVVVYGQGNPKLFRFSKQNKLIEIEPIDYNDFRLKYNGMDREQEQ